MDEKTAPNHGPETGELEQLTAAELDNVAGGAAQVSFALPEVNDEVLLTLKEPSKIASLRVAAPDDPTG